MRRKIKFFLQRLIRGWDDSDTWSLDYTLCKWLLPRLKRFRELQNGWPADFETQEEWNVVLDKIEKSIQAVANQDEDDSWFTNHREYQEGLELFGKYLINLWW